MGPSPRLNDELTRQKAYPTPPKDKDSPHRTNEFDAPPTPTQESNKSLLGAIERRAEPRTSSVENASHISTPQLITKLQERFAQPAPNITLAQDDPSLEHAGYDLLPYGLDSGLFRGQWVTKEELPAFMHLPEPVSFPTVPEKWPGHVYRAGNWISRDSEMARFLTSFPLPEAFVPLSPPVSDDYIISNHHWVHKDSPTGQAALFMDLGALQRPSSDASSATLGPAISTTVAPQCLTKTLKPHNTAATPCVQEYRPVFVSNSPIPTVSMVPEACMDNISGASRSPAENPQLAAYKQQVLSSGPTSQYVEEFTQAPMAFYGSGYSGPSPSVTVAQHTRDPIQAAAGIPSGERANNQSSGAFSPVQMHSQLQVSKLAQEQVSVPVTPQLSRAKESVQRQQSHIQTPVAPTESQMGGQVPPQTALWPQSTTRQDAPAMTQASKGQSVVRAVNQSSRNLSTESCGRHQPQSQNLGASLTSISGNAQPYVQGRQQQIGSGHIYFGGSLQRVGYSAPQTSASEETGPMSGPHQQEVSPSIQRPAHLSNRGRPQKFTGRDRTANLGQGGASTPPPLHVASPQNPSQYGGPVQHPQSNPMTPIDIPSQIHQAGFQSIPRQAVAIMDNNGCFAGWAPPPNFHPQVYFQGHPEQAGANHPQTSFSPVCHTSEPALEGPATSVLQHPCRNHDSQTPNTMAPGRRVPGSRVNQLHFMADHLTLPPRDTEPQVPGAMQSPRTVGPSTPIAQFTQEVLGYPPVASTQNYQIPQKQGKAHVPSRVGMAVAGSQITQPPPEFCGFPSFTGSTSNHPSFINMAAPPAHSMQGAQPVIYNQRTSPFSKHLPRMPGSPPNGQNDMRGPVENSNFDYMNPRELNAMSVQNPNAWDQSLGCMSQTLSQAPAPAQGISDGDWFYRRHQMNFSPRGTRDMMNHGEEIENAGDTKRMRCQ